MSIRIVVDLKIKFWLILPADRTFDFPLPPEQWPDANDMSSNSGSEMYILKHGHKMQNKEGTTLGYKLHRIEMYPFCFCTFSRKS